MLPIIVSFGFVFLNVLDIKFRLSIFIPFFETLFHIALKYKLGKALDILFMDN